MSPAIIIFAITLLAGLACIGGFLWSIVEEKPQKMWLVGAGVAVLVGIAGLVVRSG